MPERLRSILGRFYCVCVCVYIYICIYMYIWYVQEICTLQLHMPNIDIHCRVELSIHNHGKYTTLNENLCLFLGGYFSEE
jgi:hypothetical protein